jgi:hypothetical protein
MTAVPMEDVRKLGKKIRREVETAHPGRGIE